MVGLYEAHTPPDKSTYGIADINQTNGSAISLDTLVGHLTSYPISTTAFDPYHNLIFMITGDSINTYLISIDIPTGQLSTRYQVDSSGDGTPGEVSSLLYGLFFNYVDSNTYFLHLKTRSDTAWHLAKINPATNEVTDIITLPRVVSVGTPYLDCQHQKIFFIQYNPSAMPLSIVTYDLESNSFYSVPLEGVTNANVGYCFALNPNDNLLYGYEQDPSYWSAPTYLMGLRMVRVDPVTGNIAYLTPVSHLNVPGEEIVIDPVSNKIYFFAVTTNPGKDDLYCFDITSQTLTSLPVGYIDNNPNSGFTRIAFYPTLDQLPASDFTFDNVCQSFPTTFSPNLNAGSFWWNFGDPASGSSNESMLSNPDHIYSEAGTYEVTMIASTCYKSDTVIRQVTIEPFPHIGLGTDTIMCSNQPQTPLQLDVTVPGYEYEWQDQSTLPTFTVTQPGIYWVNISGSCGSISDTLKVLSQICDCGITLLPNLTEHTAYVHLDCEVTTYHHLHLELFDMLGRKVIDRSVTENDFELNVNRVSSGVLSYRFRDDNHTIQTGKLVVIH